MSCSGHFESRIFCDTKAGQFSYQRLRRVQRGQTSNGRNKKLYTIPIIEGFTRLTLLEETAISRSPFLEAFARGLFEIGHAPEHLNLEDSLWIDAVGVILQSAMGTVSVFKAERSS